MSDELPEKIEMQATLFCDGARGYAMLQYVNSEFDVTLISIRETRNDPFVQTWFSAKTGEEEFDSYEKLREAYNLLCEDAVKENARK